MGEGEGNGKGKGRRGERGVRIAEPLIFRDKGVGEMQRGCFCSLGSRGRWRGKGEREVGRRRGKGKVKGEGKGEEKGKEKGESWRV